MYRRIDTALRRIRQDLGNLLDRLTVQRVCRQVGHSWGAGILCPYATLHWFLLQVLSGNTALEHIATLTKKAFTDSAYCQARARLPLAVYQAILRALIKALIPETSNGRWHGHRTFLIDGSSFSMPDTPELQAHFGQTADGMGTARS